MRSVPKDAEWFLCLCRGDSFPRLYDFCTKWKMSFMISAPKSFLTQYIYIAMICRFLWWILTDLLFFQQIIKREIRFIFIDKSWRFFVNFINFVVHSHTMGHPKKRAVTKLRCRLVRTQMFLKTEHFVPPDRIFLSGSAWGHKRFGTPPSIKGDMKKNEAPSIEKELYPLHWKMKPSSKKWLLEIKSEYQKLPLTCVSHF